MDYADLRYSILVLVCCAAALCCAPKAQADWVFDGSANMHADQSADSPDIAFIQNTPYVTWAESWGNSRHVYVKAWDGDSWELVGSLVNHDPDQKGYAPRIAGTGGTPYVVWSEDIGSGNQNVYCKYYNGSDWELLGGTAFNRNPARDADAPCMAFHNSTPYVAWSEYDGSDYQVHVSQWNGTAWEPLGGSLNVLTDQPAQYPSLAFLNGTPFTAWQEASLANMFVRVKQWNGTDWVNAGSFSYLNVNNAANAMAPRLAATSDRVYAVWREQTGSYYDIHCKYWDGAWWSLGARVDSANTPARPAIAVYNNTPYVAWQEVATTFYRVYVRYYESGWNDLGGVINVDPGLDAQNVKIAINADHTPYVTWQEYLATKYQAYIKHFQPATATPSATATASSTATPGDTSTVTETPTATPTATVSPTVTATPTISETATAAPSATVSPTPTHTRTATMTAVAPIAGNSLRGVYPHPVRGVARFHLCLEKASQVGITVYNICGERVGYVQGWMPQADSVLEWDSHGVAPGIYIARVHADGQCVANQKLAVVK